MAKAERINGIVVPDDSNLTISTIKPLEAGIYTLEVKEAYVSEIKAGKHEGKDTLTLKLATSTNRIVWKQIPLWQAPEEDTIEARKERDWMRMSRKALVESLKLTNRELIAAPEMLIGRLLECKVGIQQNNGYAPQNFVITFVGGDAE